MENRRNSNSIIDLLRTDIASGKLTIQKAINILGSDEELFIAATGVRRLELKQMRTEDITLAENGECIVSIRGHGIRKRVIRTRSADVSRIVRTAEASGREFVFVQNLNKRISFYTMRCMFATAVYQSKARPVKDLPSTEQIHCQVRDQKLVLDRSALMYTTEALGVRYWDMAARCLLIDPNNPCYLVLD